MADYKRKTKAIKITTTDDLGFAEMSDIKHRIDKMLKEYQAQYKVKYYFE